MQQDQYIWNPTNIKGKAEAFQSIQRIWTKVAELLLMIPIVWVGIFSEETLVLQKYK